MSYLMDMLCVDRGYKHNLIGKLISLNHSKKWRYINAQNGLPSSVPDNFFEIKPQKDFIF